ncbi:MAG: cytochrome c-type biogenesis protein [Gemmatimonadota bacterium]|nr:cytochrome c-type biogenesis protein [Gemmatimonadota bacterium]
MNGRTGVAARAAAALGLVLFAALAGAPAGAAQEPIGTRPAPSTGTALTDPEAERLDAEAAELSAQLRCPVCRNQSILESNAELSREMQALVHERLAAGDSPEEVKSYFVSRYGEWILLEPSRRGINLLVWGLPFVALLVGGAIAIRLLRRWSTSGPGNHDASSPVDTGLSAENEMWLQEALRDG